jgi:hypothetical protein
MKMRFLQNAKGRVIAAVEVRPLARSVVGIAPVAPKGYRFKDVTVSNPKTLEKRFPKGK